MKRWIFILTLAGALAGCQSSVDESLWNQIGTLSEEKTELSLKIEKLQEENQTLAEQVQTLSAIDKDTRLAWLPAVQQIRIGRYSGLYNKEHQGQAADSLIVYVEPIDAAQDTVKAAGNVQVELWNLAIEPERAKLAAWEVGAEELKTLWGRGLLGAYYRMVFGVQEILKGDEKELTLTVRFTDYLTGKVLTDQKVITP